MRKELNLGNAFTLGLTARFSWAKNHHFLLDIFDEVLKMDPSAKLLLVGDGELRKDIEAKMHELGLAEHVIMTGVRSDVQNLLQAMDVFVMPSNYEGLGWRQLRHRQQDFLVSFLKKFRKHVKLRTQFIISLCQNQQEHGQVKYYQLRVRREKHISRNQEFRL